MQAETGLGVDIEGVAGRGEKLLVEAGFESCELRAGLDRDDFAEIWEDRGCEWL